MLASFGQNGGVGIGVLTPNKNAVLELVSPGNNQGLLVPKMTTGQRTSPTFTGALSLVEAGLLIFDTDDGKFYFWIGTGWQPVGTSIPQDLQLVGSQLSITNNPAATKIDLSPFQGTNTDGQTLSYAPATGQLSISTLAAPQAVTITAAGTAGGVLTGSYPSPGIADNSVTTSTILDGTITAADLSGLSIDDSKLASGISVIKLAAGANGQVLTTTGGAVSWNNPATGSVSSISTGTGLTGGPITTTGTINLANTAVTPGNYGSVSSVPQIIVDAQGRITAAASVTISGVAPGGTAGGDLTGNYPNPTLGVSAVTSSKILDGAIVDVDIAPAAAITVSKFSPGTNGQILTTSAGISSWATPSFGTVSSIATGVGLNGGPVTSTGTISLANTTVTPGTYGSATTVPQVTIDAQGRITNAATVTVSGTAPGGAAGGDLAGNYPNPTVAANAITSAKIVDATIIDADISGAAAITVSKFSVGTNGQILTTAGGVSQWANPSGSILINNAGTRNLFAGSPIGNSSGTDNTTYGSASGAATATGSYNVAMGSGAGLGNNTGNLNTLIGWQAGLATGSATTFNGNTYIGAQAGQSSTTGPNTFIGEKAGQATTAGTQNVFVGNSAALANTIGAQNTVIGYNSNVSVGNLLNATAIGYTTIVDANNKVRIGNTSIVTIEGQVPFTNASDKRFKKDIAGLTAGLDFILKLNPVSYRMKTSGESRLNWGFIAQEIEALVGTDNAILTIGGDQDRHLGLRYTDFIAPLVKAVQEQQNEIAAMKEAIMQKDGRIQKLEEAFLSMKAENSKMGELKSEVEKIKKSMGL